MKIEPRYKLNKNREQVIRGLVLYPNKVESRWIDEAMGDIILDDDGLIAKGKVEVRLSDGYRRHYLYIPAITTKGE